MTDTKNNKAVSQSAVYNYIMSDGSLGNIEYDFTSIKNNKAISQGAVSSYITSDNNLVNIEYDFTRTRNFLNQYQADNSITDLLSIDITTPTGNNNISGVVHTENASTLINSPVTSGAFYATREVQSIKSGHNGYKVNVILTENYPKSGRVWINCYNPDIGDWTGWYSDYNETTYTTVTTGYSYTPMNRLYRNGKNRSLSFALRSDVPINNGLYNIVANIIDEKDYPISEIRSSCVITKVSDGQILGVGEVKIDTNGNVSVKSSVGENYNEIYVNISWITQ